ncbi:MAG: hypothetical protein V4629_07055 [Pseudomonadota bacterium]
MVNHNIVAQNLSNLEWLKLQPESIPNNLKSQPFAVWKAEPRVGSQGKFNKAPLSPKTGQKIGANKPDLFGSFDEALKSYSVGGYTGIGVLLTGNGIVGVDIDNYESLFTQQPQVKHFVSNAIAMGIYCEYSPSATGLRLFTLGKLPSTGRKCGGLEIYDNARFLTITGHLFDARKVGA